MMLIKFSTAPSRAIITPDSTTELQFITRIITSPLLSARDDRRKLLCPHHTNASAPLLTICPRHVLHTSALFCDAHSAGIELSGMSTVTGHL